MECFAKWKGHSSRMKTILFADWLLADISQVLVKYMEFEHCNYRTVLAGDLAEAVTLIPIEKPDLIVSQPALFCMENSRLLKAIQMQTPVPPILVWGSEVIVPSFKNTCLHPASVRYVMMPFKLEILVQQVQELLEAVGGGETNT